MYQPGPGLDSRPGASGPQDSIKEWAAGAGVDAVLTSDQQLLPYIFPGGTPTAAALNPDIAYHNIREIPQPFQFLDWNHWLPQVHPMDSYSDWENNPGVNGYYALRGDLDGGADFAGVVEPAWQNFQQQILIYEGNKVTPLSNANAFTPVTSRQVYSTAQWTMVKLWELMNEFNLQDQAHNEVFVGTGVGLPANITEPRGWWSDVPFRTSPHILHLPLTDDRGIINEKYTNLLADSWYRLQFVLYSHRYAPGNEPIDFPYSWAFIHGTGQQTGEPVALQLLLGIQKSAEMRTPGVGPDQWNNTGWSPAGLTDVSSFALPDSAQVWSGETGIQAQVSNALLGAWMAKNLQYPTTAYWGATPETGALVDPTAIPNGVAFYGPIFDDKLWSMIPHYRSFGVDESLLQSIINWTQTLYPKGAWDLIRTGTDAPRIETLPAADFTFATPSTTTLFALTLNTTTPTLQLYFNDVKVADVASDTNTTGGFLYSYVWQPTSSGTYTTRWQADYSFGSFHDVVRSGHRHRRQPIPVPPPISGQPTGPGTTVTPAPTINVRVYPNPWRKDKHDGNPMTFSGLVAGTTIKIFTVSGHKVKELQTNGPSVPWDLTNDSGDKVASGIYVYLMTDGQGDKVRGKLAVVK